MRGNIASLECAIHRYSRYRWPCEPETPNAHQVELQNHGLETRNDALKQEHIALGEGWHFWRNDLLFEVLNSLETRTPLRYCNIFCSKCSRFSSSDFPTGQQTSYLSKFYLTMWFYCHCNLVQRSCSSSIVSHLMHLKCYRDKRMEATENFLVCYRSTATCKRKNRIVSLLNELHKYLITSMWENIKSCNRDICCSALLTERFQREISWAERTEKCAHQW